MVYQIVSSASTDLQDYTYYFVPAPWLSCKLLRLLQCYPPPEDGAVKGRLVECLETILNKAQEPPKSKKVQHSNAKNAILFEAISLIIHYDRWAFHLTAWQYSYSTSSFFQRIHNYYKWLKVLQVVLVKDYLKDFLSQRRILIEEKTV